MRCPRLRCACGLVRCCHVAASRQVESRADCKGSSRGWCQSPGYRRPCRGFLAARSSLRYIGWYLILSIFVRREGCGEAGGAQGRNARGGRAPHRGGGGRGRDTQGQRDQPRVPAARRLLRLRVALPGRPRARVAGHGAVRAALRRRPGRVPFGLRGAAHTLLLRVRPAARHAHLHHRAAAAPDHCRVRGHAPQAAAQVPPRRRPRRGQDHHGGTPHQGAHDPRRGGALSHRLPGKPRAAVGGGRAGAEVRP